MSILPQKKVKTVLITQVQKGISSSSHASPMQLQ